LDATIRVLQQEGLERATTSRIAEVAGVSVGTLYQYFSNRDEILEALQEREFERATAMLEEVLVTNDTGSDRQVARRLVQRLLALYAESPALHRVLVVEGLRVTPTDRVHAFDLRTVNAIRGFLGAANVRLRRDNLDAAAFVAFQSVRAAMLSWLFERPAGVDDETLVEELTDLVLRYLVED
jgi:AcrR family transcriptional regulator